jgi:hypothetical protein
MKTTFRFVRPAVLPAALSAAVLLACGGEETVSSGAAGYDASLNVLTDADGLSIVPMRIKGTYGAECKVNRGETWELKLNEGGFGDLSVALNETFSDCPLTLTTIRMQEGNRPRLTDYTVAPPIVLSLGYATGPSAVHAPSRGLAFYTNAKLEGLSEPVYSNNFKVGVIYSDNAQACGNVAPPAIYSQVTATAHGSSVPPPNYSMSFDTLRLVVDANDVVQDASQGSVDLDPPVLGAQGGEEYKIFDEHIPCCETFSFEEIDTIYRTANPVGTGIISAGGTVSIPWKSFGLEGKRLRQDRFIIVKHTGEGGVYSYELLDVAFPGPRP